MTLKISKKNPLLWLYVGGALLLAVAVWVWCFKISMDPQRVFWATIERGLATQGVTVQAEQSGNGTSSNQLTSYSLGANSLSHSRTTLTQGATTVVSEVMGTTTDDYNRYVSIKTDQKRDDGGEIDFSKVLGVWAKNPGGQLFSQTVLGASLPVGGMVVPVGNLNPKTRADVFKQLRDDAVYQVSFDKVQKEKSEGRLLYTYDVAVQPVGYVALIKSFSQGLGLHALDQVDPAQYKGQQPFKVKITIDARAQQVVSVVATESDASQRYYGYGMPVRAELPTNTVTAAELQKRLSNLQ